MEWIKCSDRVPDSSSDVTIFSAKHGVVNGYYWNDVDYLGIESAKWFVSSSESEALADDITHWQPLPPPPAD